MVRRYNGEAIAGPRPRSYSGATPRLSVQMWRNGPCVDQGVSSVPAKFNSPDRRRRSVTSIAKCQPQVIRSGMIETSDCARRRTAGPNFVDGQGRKHTLRLRTVENSMSEYWTSQIVTNWFEVGFVKSLSTSA